MQKNKQKKHGNITCTVWMFHLLPPRLNQTTPRLIVMIYTNPNKIPKDLRSLHWTLCFKEVIMLRSTPQREPKVTSYSERMWVYIWIMLQFENI